MREMQFTNKIYVGIDPGKSGAITILSGDEVETIGFPLIGKDYDIKGINEIFHRISNLNCHVIIEDVKALQGLMKAGNWSLSRGKTILEVCCVCNSIPYTLVHSKTWQKEMWQGIPVQHKGKTAKGAPKVNTKAMSLLAAKRLFPNVDLRDPNRKTDRSVKPHDGVVDSLLLSEYGKRRNL